MGHARKQACIPGKTASTVLFCAVLAAWLALDRATKALLAHFAVGDVIARKVLVLFDFVLVHNTGGAWGIFSGSTMVLGLFSVAVCAFLCLYFFAMRKTQVHVLECIGLALVVAGGLGNAIDRFANGYVLDFICANFIDFPVFNVADIGVTCGLPLFFIGYWLYLSRSGALAEGAGEGESA